MFPLKVFKASAGSGKTFTLTVEYIKLLIADPTVYKHILAVTFTNKATAEMKSRIINQLYGISRSLPNSDGYFKAIKADRSISRLNLADSVIRERAGQALSLIIHDYSRFHIETIDSFFQSIIKELARELDLTANLRIDLNDKEVLGEAVKGIIAELQDGTDTFRSVIDFVMEKIEEGKNWNIESEIEEFGRNIFNEHYIEQERLIRDNIADPEFLKKYKNKLYATKTKAENELKACGQEFIDLCSRDGLEQSDFKYGATGIHRFFSKLSEGEMPEPKARVHSCVDNTAEWAKTPQAKSAVTEEYTALLNRTLTTYKATEQAIATTTAISAHLNHLMMLDMINCKVRLLNQEANRFLLSDTAHFLRDMIDGSDIPFIYERTGNRFKHIMIDEFQDTSSLQWENFKPLLSNCLSQEQQCLIVGDVKQSIYRWRNSDWNILNNIQACEFGGMIDPTSIARLDTNHRSAEHVVEFNNNFFRQAAVKVGAKFEAVCGHHTEDVENAYRETVQKVTQSKRGQGYVRIVDITPEDKDADYTQITLERLRDTVDELIANGVKANDITILIRVNRLIPTICQYFIDQNSGIKIVSEEAFRLSSSASVNIIMLALKCIMDTEDVISRLSLAYLYQVEVLGNKDIQGDISALMPSEPSLSAKMSCPIDEFLPADFLSGMKRFALTPLAELTEELYRVFQLDRIAAQDAYLFCFYDNVTSFLQERTADMQEFINYWDETLKDKTIPDNSLDGIRIMSIHKSKGLEFHTVILPFCDWDMNGRHSNILWCEPTEAPYNELSLTPVNFNKTTQTSIFRRDYEQETLKNFVDNLNLVYVAFTRAESNLIVFTSSNPSNKNKNYTTADVILDVINDSNSPLQMEQNGDDVATLHTFGTMMASKPDDNQEDDKDNTPIWARFIHHNLTASFRQSNRSELFITDSEEAENQERYINEGNIIHHALEFISSPDDIDRAILQLDTEGCFSNEEDKHRIRTKLAKSFANPRTKEWFSPKWKVYSERSILTTDEDGKTTTIRPDRVMTDGKQTIVIDYKTGKQDARHITQVQDYMTHLSQMGHTSIRGYLWYIGRDEIIEVKREK